ncbi:hypothetical protein [Flaviaesturariibacter aridisoli]|uniref:C2H2-type domain-containing protein n=1 Tax=Flaviaesturariibacter aridisoli TaxID=2545761 RepID=A0A4V2WMP0_9BACT|nr:hypothetical protein [Flaviaesturariibacter aridisoli]TCZ70514.1 hypothetical protein E0486_11195 [Flaviaesturariibacter aridisoli]
MSPEHSAASSPNEHYLRCPECGALFDMRDLMAVLEHQHRAAPLPRIPYSHAEPAPLPMQFPRRRTHSN